MVTIQAIPTLQQALKLANQFLRAGDARAADAFWPPFWSASPSDPRLLHLTGLVRMHQQRFEDAARLFENARAADPREALLAFSHGTALRWLERHVEATDAFKHAITLKPDYAEAYFEAGATLRQLGELDARRDDIPPMAHGIAGSCPRHAGPGRSAARH